MKLSISAYARHRGVSHVAVLKAIKSGRIEKEPDGTIDVAKADVAWAKNTSPAQKRRKDTATVQALSARPATETPALNHGPSYAQSRAVKEAYHARLAKLSYEEKSGALIKTDVVKVAWFNTLRVLRDRILNMPDRMAPIMAAESDPKIIRDFLDKELRQALEDAADAVVQTSNATE